jgi:hypothetical protein
MDLGALITNYHDHETTHENPTFDLECHHLSRPEIFRYGVPA